MRPLIDIKQHHSCHPSVTCHIPSQSEQLALVCFGGTRPSGWAWGGLFQLPAFSLLPAFGSILSSFPPSLSTPLKPPASAGPVKGELETQVQGPDGPLLSACLGAVLLASPSLRYLFSDGIGASFPACERRAGINKVVSGGLALLQ